MQLITFGEALHSAQLGAAGLHREHEAGTHRFAVHEDRAGAAYAMLAAEMSAGEIQLLADEIRQRHPYFDQTFIGSSVDGNFDELALRSMAHPFFCLGHRRLQCPANQHAADFLAVFSRSVNIRIGLKFFGDDSAQLA